MRLYSLQDPAVWEQAQESGFFEADASKGWGREESFARSYDWLKKQMKERIPNYQGEDMLWFWLEKPDMRSTGHGESGAPAVRLTLEVPDDQVLVSDFYKWHAVLNDWPCFAEKSEEDLFWDEKGNDIPGTEEAKLKTWERIFERGCLANENSYWCSNTRLHFQTTTGRIPISMVNKVEFFTFR